MHVQDVNPQPVPLLERPAAQMTGELPVPLVHAARVLQVFVSVVLVGEHLPASVALEALPGIWRQNKPIYGGLELDYVTAGDLRNLTFGEGARAAVLSGVLQGERDPEELRITVSVPHQQLLARPDLLAGLVEDLGLDLHRRQVLLLREARALHQRHPVP